MMNEVTDALGDEVPARAKPAFLYTLDAFRAVFPGIDPVGVRFGFRHGYAAGRDQPAVDGAARTIEVGAVVRLRSGGHLMTVTGVSCGSFVDVTFSHDGELVSEEVPRAGLHILTPAMLEAEHRRLDLDVPY